MNFGNNKIKFSKMKGPFLYSILCLKSYCPPLIYMYILYSHEMRSIAVNIFLRRIMLYFKKFISHNLFAFVWFRVIESLSSPTFLGDFYTSPLSIKYLLN